MAQKNITMLVDDIDGGEATETVRFGLDGVEYEIDLSEGNASSLRDAFSTWVGHARRTGGRSSAGGGGRRRGRAGSSSGSGSGGDSSAIREWAREKGMTVSDRGRIPAQVRSAYEEAHA